MKKYNVLLMWLAVVGLAVGAFCGEIPPGGYGKPDDCRVDTFVKTKWGQTTANGYSDGPRCFNYYVTNQVDAAKDYAGCFPAAVAQVMRYWQCDCTNGRVAVDCVISDGTTVATNALVTFGGPYAWDNMPEKTTELTGGDVIQCEAIGKLMHDLAVASASTFTPNHAVANPLDVYKCLTERVGGFANVEMAIFNSGNCPYSVDRLEQLVVPNLDAGAPVILALAFEGAVITHSAVVDGYGYDRANRLMLHANFGAWGNGDGWYYADEGFCVGEQTYSSVSVCLYNLFPEERGSAVSGRVLDVSRRAVGGAVVKAFSGETCVAECTTGANGVYAFVLAPGEYVVKAEKDGFAAELPPFKVGATDSRQISDAEATAAGNYRSEPEYAPSIGNSFGHDLLLPGLYSDQAAAPTVSPADGAKISCATNVTLSCTTSNAVIRYTLDGTEPTLQSPRYTEPFEVLGDPVTVKAIAFARNMNPSTVVSATFTYDNKNADKLLGDDRTAPWMLTGTNVELTVKNYRNYDRADDDPIVDKELFDYTWGNPDYMTESHSAWFRWTAPGTGEVRLFGTVQGPAEWGYNINMVWDCYPPYYGISMAVYAEGDVSPERALARTESYIEGDYVKHWERADQTFEVKQGKTYLIQCECPYHLRTDYLGYVDDNGNWGYFDGPYFFQCQKEVLGRYYSTPQGDWYTVPFHSENAELYLKLEAGGLQVEPPPPARMTVPNLAHATVRVLADGTEVKVTGDGLQLEQNVNYTITYTAWDGYAFDEDGKVTTWAAIVRDDTGADFSVAELEDFPQKGPIPVQWNRPTTDAGVTDALKVNGFNDDELLEKVTTLPAFDAFVDYLVSVIGVNSPDQLTDGQNGQKKNAFRCYQLGATMIPEGDWEIARGVSVVFSTLDEATNMANIAAFKPSAEVAAVFGGDVDSKAKYCARFGFEVVPTSDGKWAVEARLKPEAWTEVVKSAQAATRQIEVADFAAMATAGKKDVKVVRCVPGFYYTLRGSKSLEGLGSLEGLEGLDVYGPVLCDVSGDVTFPKVEKPSDKAGFFSIEVKETRDGEPLDRFPVKMEPPSTIGIQE